jgi:Na+-driven multidrug efflux pump
VFLYGSKRGVRWVWPIPGSKVGATAGKLLHLTAPIALSEVLWGMSTFIYTVVFTRLGTTMLAASQIVLSLENMFIVASAGLAPAAVAVIGQALGMGSLPAAKSNAWLTIRFGFLLAPRAWFAVRGLEPVASRALSEGGSRGSAPRFLGSVADGGDAAGQGAKQRTR